MSTAAAQEDYRLRLNPQARGSLAMPVGTLDIGRTDDGSLGPVPADVAQLRFILDDRGLWLDVRDACHGVHVNGRPVRRIARLRGGDVAHLDGGELQVLGRLPDDAANLPPAEDAAGDLRVVLRGNGGQHHGRALPLDRPRLIGSGEQADIRIDDAGVAGSHARLECLADGRVLLRDLSGGRGVLVNGHPACDALLHPGDQIVFDARHRFLIEAPSPLSQAGPLPMPAPETVRVEGSGSWQRLPWILLAALLIAGLLSLLLFFGG